MQKDKLPVRSSEKFIILMLKYKSTLIYNMLINRLKIQMVSFEMIFLRMEVTTELSSALDRSNKTLVGIDLMRC